MAGSAANTHCTITRLKDELHGVFVFGAPAVDRSKAPRALAAAMPGDQTRREVRIGAYGYFQPSFVFYCRREVKVLESEPQLVAFLRLPLECYVVLPAERWEEMRSRLPETTQELARHYDLYDGKEIVLIANGARTFSTGFHLSTIEIISQFAC